MSIVVNSNIASLNAQRNLGTTGSQLETSMQRLSSGRRLNSSKDDAAGMAISSRMGSQISGMKVAQRNAGDGISLAQTAEGAIGEMTGMLSKMRDLALQSKNGTNSDDDRSNLHQEFSELSDEIKRTYSSVSFNEQKIIGSDATSFVFQVGANNGDEVKISLQNVASMSGVANVLSGTISTVSGASDGITAIDTALNAINSSRAKLGAAQTRFDATISNLGNSIENQSAALGRIVDTDFASETANLSKVQVLQQAGVAMLSQANQTPQLALSLLR
jgi:flagellin